MLLFVVNSHVVLGFSRCGHLLLSYCSELEITAAQASYTLHCWAFSGRSPLSHVSTTSAQQLLVIVCVCV